MDIGTAPFIRLFNEKYALDISVYDNSFLEKVIKSRIISTGCETDENYLKFLIEVPVEKKEFIHQLSNSFSEFFRNPITFSILEKLVIPRIFEGNLMRNSGEIRIWSAGCSTGQEPYSLAILFNEYFEQRQMKCRPRIFATDYSHALLEHAQAGIFDFKSVKNARLEFAEKYFNVKGKNFHIDRKIKDLVNFSVYDLLARDSSSPPMAIYGDFDLILCSNVLIYYKAEFQQLILQKIYRSLKSGGFFITGEAESGLVGSWGGFRPYLSPSAIFVKS